MTPMYLDAEVGRMQAEADRRAGIRTPVPRAEPDQVVRSAVRDDQGRILGRYAGAITAGMTNKTDVLGMRSMMPNAPTNEGSTYQMDLMDMSTRGGATGFGLLAADVNSRYLYGELVRDKTLPGLLAAFSRLARACAFSMHPAPRVARLARVVARLS